MMWNMHAHKVATLLFFRALPREGNESMVTTVWGGGGGGYTYIHTYITYLTFLYQDLLSPERKCGRSLPPKYLDNAYLIVLLGNGINAQGRADHYQQIAGCQVLTRTSVELRRQRLPEKDEVWPNQCPTFIVRPVNFDHASLIKH